MADKQETTAPSQTKLVGLLAEFDGPDALVSAAASVRQAGYHRIEAYSPFPVHGIDEAMGIKPTILPWIVLGGGVSGALLALVGQWWTNAVDYPFMISGKPMFSLPANIPVIFEVVILLSAFSAFFGMLVLNGLPKFIQPLFKKPQFLRATNDRFFLLVGADDPKFSSDGTPELLRSLGAADVDTCHDDARPVRLPKGIGTALVILGLLALIPPILIASSRATTSAKPRWHTWIDMDYQPKFKAQNTSTFFNDGRAARQPVAGTIARGELQDNIPLYRGFDPDAPPPAPPKPIPAADGTVPPPSDEPLVAWVTEFPLPVSDQMMFRGQQRFNIYCAACHGLTGAGNGLVSKRALELQQGTWVPPTSLHQEYVRNQPVGQLYNTITNGIRKMPAYGSQIPVEDRWAIVLYIRALQRSQNATSADVPPEMLQTLRDLN